jgi:hypothetical protein
MSTSGLKAYWTARDYNPQYYQKAKSVAFTQPNTEPSPQRKRNNTPQIIFTHNTSTRQRMAFPPPPLGLLRVHSQPSRSISTPTPTATTRHMLPPPCPKPPPRTHRRIEKMPSAHHSSSQLTSAQTAHTATVPCGGTSGAGRRAGARLGRYLESRISLVAEAAGAGADL